MRTKIGLAPIVLLLLCIRLPTSHAEVFSKGQSAAISIGEWKSISYGIMSPDGGLAFDPSGKLWIADTYNNRVLGFTPPFSGNMSATYVIGQSSFQGTKYGNGSARMGRPIGITTDSKGNVWVVDLDNSRILEFKPPFHNGMSASIVLGQKDFKGIEPSLSRSGLYPEWITFDAAGNLWVSDGGNSRVLEFQPPFGTGMNASLVIGQPDFTHNDCPVQSEGCESWTILHGPGDMAFDPAGDLWVTEYGSNPERLLEFKPPFGNGMRASTIFSGKYPAANVLAFDSEGNLWMGLAQGVFEFKPPFSNPFNEPLNVNASLGGYPGEYWSQSMLTPSGLTFDSSRNLWVSDCATCWLMPDWDGRVLGYDAHVHSIHTSAGEVSFSNSAGLLLPLSFLQLTQMDSIQFPDGIFNFTVQGLPPGSRITLAITFSHPLPSGIEWVSKVSGQWYLLPANKTSILGNNMTLMLGGASPTGVISVFGGPAYPPPNLTSVSETGSTLIITTTPLNAQNQNASPTFILGAIAVTVVVVAVLAIRKRRRKM